MQRRFCCTLSVIEEKMKIFRDLDFRRSRKIFITISSIQRFIFSYVFSGSKQRERERERERERGTFSYLGVVDGAVGDDGEEGESEGECSGDTCLNGNSGTTLHFFHLSENAGDDCILLRFLEYSIFIKILFSETSRSGTEKNIILQNCPCSVGKKIKSCPELIMALCWFFWNFIF